MSEVGPPNAGISAIVLAGGRSARFGRDKLDEQLMGETVLERAVRLAGAIAGEVLVAGRALEPLTPRVRSLADPEPFGGPLVGLAAALDAADGVHAIVVGGDMPAAVPAVLEAMLQRLASDPSIDAVILGRPHEDDAPPQVLPMALEIARARLAARVALDRGNRSLRSLLEALRSTSVAAEEWRRLDPDGMTLLDVDTTADLTRIRALLAE